MKVFVISLDGASQRRTNATSQMGDANVDFEFFDAVRGDRQVLEDVFDAYDERTYLLGTGRVATDGEIGCYASHLAVWKKCVELDEPVMIMEDDFDLADEFADAVKFVEQNIDEYKYIRLQSETRGKKKKIKKSGIFELWQYTRVPHSLMCYAIAPDVARALVASSRILTAPVDVHVKKFWEHRQLIYGLTPYTVTESQLSADTSITGRVKTRKTLSTKIWRVITKCQWFLRRQAFNVKNKNV